MVILQPDGGVSPWRQPGRKALDDHGPASDLVIIFKIRAFK